MRSLSIAANAYVKRYNINLDIRFDIITVVGQPTGTNELGGKYLQDCALYVTVEPCIMCAGAIGWAQLRRIVYGCPDEKRGYHEYAPKAFHPKANVTYGVMEEECRALMQRFFQERR